jgi:hypothetical protein
MDRGGTMPGSVHERPRAKQNRYADQVLALSVRWGDNRRSTTEVR